MTLQRLPADYLHTSGNILKVLQKRNFCTLMISSIAVPTYFLNLQKMEGLIVPKIFNIGAYFIYFWIYKAGLLSLFMCISLRVGAAATQQRCELLAVEAVYL